MGCSPPRSATRPRADQYAVAERLLSCGRDSRVAGESEGQVPNLSFPLVLDAAPGNEHQILDHRRDGGFARDREHSRHGQALPNSVIGIPEQGIDVVGEENPLFARCPIQDGGIVCTGQAGLLNRADIDVRLATQLRPDQVRVEVFVSRESNHAGGIWRAIKRSRMPWGSKRRSISQRRFAASVLRAERYVSTPSWARR